MANNTQLASDNFQRVGPSLGANWTAVFGMVTGQIVSNVVEATAVSTNCGQVYSGIAWPNDQASELTIGTLTAEAGTFLSLLVRQSTTVNRTGYQLDLSNGTAILNKVVAGVSTQLGATVSGLTIAAGDVWVLQAAGACISAYQNNKKIIFFDDAAITSGSPGFLNTTSVNITHSTVASWRGYNTVQQDGIWAKQGIVIPALASDLDVTFNGTANPSNILFEGGAQILSGNVYKIWFSGGQNIYYAESLDGVNWTRRGTAVLTSRGFPRVIKNGATYYMYCGPVTGGASIILYTSPDGINWTLNSTVLLPGTAGAWDDGQLYYFQPVQIVNGAWTAIYTGGHASNPVLHTGVATSSDGITWVKSVSNPVALDFCAAVPVKVGSTWYAWGGTNQPGLGNPLSSNVDPTDTVRLQSTDLITWTNRVRSIHHSEIFEGVNANRGQAFPGPVIDINGKAYMYYTGSPEDSTAPQVYQIALAIAPATIASIVTKSEDAVTQVASDNFNRVNGGLGANWTTITGTSPLQIVSNLAESSVNAANNAAVYTGATFNNDHYSEVTINTLASANDFIIPLVRSASGVRTWYEADIAGPTGTANAQVAIFQRINNVATQLGPTATITTQIGDVLRLSAVGNVISLYQNGALILQVQDMSAGAITTGNPGFLTFTTVAITNAKVSLWAGGNANTIPFYVFSYVDDRAFGIFPNKSRNVQLTNIYDVVPAESRVPAIIPVDSRAASITSVDSRTSIDVPLNSRNTPS